MSVFVIENLRCSYQNKEQPVVFIEKLEIPRGKLTVILGRSGSGKSTLVEALGLMNNTIQGGKVHYHSPDGLIDLAQIWHKPRKVAAIRKDYFSFIFQDDYLMPHYTCGENVLIARLIQGGISRAFANDLLDKPMNSLKLSGNGLQMRFPFQIAGGQKQRLSFTRAVVKNFDMLFGDEPTGNLDNKSSVDLFDFIKEIIREKHCSAIIVSHNIELSVEKADKIIVLTPSDDNLSHFTMKPEHVFCRDSDKVWDERYKSELVNSIKLIL
jgi:ABC-type lipoprotein export system ATPase subunit